MPCRLPCSANVWKALTISSLRVRRLKKGGVSVLRRAFSPGFALEELNALFAIAPVARNVPFASHSIIGALFIGAEELTGIHSRHLLHWLFAIGPSPQFTTYLRLAIKANLQYGRMMRGRNSQTLRFNLKRTPL